MASNGTPRISSAVQTLAETRRGKRRLRPACDHPEQRVQSEISLPWLSRADQVKLRCGKRPSVEKSVGNAAASKRGTISDREAVLEVANCCLYAVIQYAREGGIAGPNECRLHGP